MRVRRLSCVVATSVLLALAACGDDSASSSVGAAAAPITNAAGPATSAGAPATAAGTTTAVVTGPAVTPASTATAAPATAAPATTGAATAAAVPEVLRFQAARIGGGTVDAAVYAGKPVAFWFWAPG
jgi:hypothetical protein